MNEGRKISKGKKWRKFAALVFAVVFSCTAAVPAAFAGERVCQSAKSLKAVVPVGKAVGIKLYSDGLLVVELNEVSGKTSPAEAGGIKVGDFIVSAGGENLENAEQLQKIVSQWGEEPMPVTIKRSGKTVNATVQPIADDGGAKRLGAWVRDSMAGIGTVTFYDVETGEFGALGHGITDVDTTLLMPLSSGSILENTVTSVKKGEAGTPGELHGDIKVNSEIGDITANTTCGVFGKAEECLTASDEIPVADSSEVHTGKATILSNIDSDTTAEYDIEIAKIMPSASDGRDMVIKVKDSDLIKKTGGIVQGMSGSPIIQDGKIVGAVTHVMVNDPTRGYGIFIQNMLGAAVG